MLGIGVTLLSRDFKEFGKKGFTGYCLIVSSMCLGVLGVCRAVMYYGDYNDFSEKLSSTINDERICRLKDKIRKIEQKLGQEITEVEREQLNRVNDYFHLKEVEMFSFKTNQMQVKHVRV
jgi:hypothetical protein